MAIPVSRLIIDWRFGNFQNKPQKTLKSFEVCFGSCQNANQLSNDSQGLPFNIAQLS